MRLGRPGPALPSLAEQEGEGLAADAARIGGRPVGAPAGLVSTENTIRAPDLQRSGSAGWDAIPPVPKVRRGFRRFRSQLRSTDPRCGPSGLRSGPG
jgi:hypothetical protein